MEFNAEQERITKNLNNELYDYVKRIVAAVKYNGEGDHEDVPSILKEFAKGYEQRIKELTEENERLRAEISVKKKLLDKCVALEDEVRVDTVRKMQDRLHKRFKSDRDAIYTGYNIHRYIDQITKEMLEEK